LISRSIEHPKYSIVDFKPMINNTHQASHKSLTSGQINNSLNTIHSSINKPTDKVYLPVLKTNQIKLQTDFRTDSALQ